MTRTAPRPVPARAAGGAGAGAPAAGWHPDPLGRHAHRWWDGEGWTAQVADAGVVSNDAAIAPVADPDHATSGGSVRVRRRAAAAAIGAGAALVAALAVVVVAASPPATCTTSDQALDARLGPGELWTRCVRVEAGQAVRVRAEPVDGQDVVLAVAVADEVVDDPRLSRDGAPPFADDLTVDLLTGELAGAAGSDDLGSVVLVADERAQGEPEAAAVPPLPVDVELTLVVAGFEGAGGDVTVDIEVLDPPAGFEPDRYADLEAFEDEFVDTAEYDAHYGPFFEGDFYP